MQQNSHTLLRFRKYYQNDSQNTCRIQWMEIHLYIQPPWWTLKAKICIDESKEEAKKYHDRAEPNVMNNSTIHIYTDGSGINGNISAAAYCSSTGQKERQYLGKDTTHNVNAADLETINLAIK
jgi:hypothetical protein